MYNQKAKGVLAVENGAILQLVDGSHIAIIGGGPAGCFTALNLARFAAERELKLNITILEGRDFERPGPAGCNKCAGILSSELLQKMKTVGLEIPQDVIQAELKEYILHIGEHKVPIHQPDPSRRILSVYRGGGPRLGETPHPHSFDAWLLSQAQKHGATLLQERVQQVEQGEKPVVKTAHHSLEVDLVVLATGVNSRHPLEKSWGYIPPLTVTMNQDELPTSHDTSAEYSDESAHIFVGYPRGLIFGGVIPKGRYANVSLLGRELRPNAMEEFLEAYGFASLYEGNVPRLCGCSPQVAITPAKGYYHDRMVAVGDAAVTRLYKDGIGSAFITAEAAARTAVFGGISQEDFARQYRPVCQKIAGDNQYGKRLFALWDLIYRFPFLVDSWQATVLAETTRPNPERTHSRILWGMFTGDEPYRRIFWLFCSPPALHSLMLGALQARRHAHG